MNLPKTWLNPAVAMATAAALLSPVLALAQAKMPAEHMHAMPPAAASAADAPDMAAAMHKMHADMEAMKPTGDVDHDFAMMMRTHHQGAIEMAKIELARGKDKEAKQMAQKMITDQTKEIAKLDKWMAHHTGMKK